MPTIPGSLPGFLLRGLRPRRGPATLILTRYRRGSTPNVAYGGVYTVLFANLTTTFGTFFRTWFSVTAYRAHGRFRHSDGVLIIVRSIRKYGIFKRSGSPQVCDGSPVDQAP